MISRNAVVAVASLTLTPSSAHAQKPDEWTFHVGVGVGAIYTDKSLGTLDPEGGTAALRTSPIVNLSLLTTTPLEWLRFRAAMSTTLHARLTAKTFSHFSSCGTNCLHLNYDHTPLSRGFNATHATLSIELVPFSGASVSPHLEVGVGFKRLAFGDGPTEGYERLDGSMIGGVYLVGLGFDVPIGPGRLRFSASDTFRSTVDPGHESETVIQQIEQSARHDFRVITEYIWSPW